MSPSRRVGGKPASTAGRTSSARGDGASPGRLAAIAAAAHACCGTSRLDENGAKVLLPSAAESHCLSGTAYQRNHGHTARLADGILFWSPAADTAEVAAAIELKGGRVDVAVVVDQLQEAAAVAEKIAAGMPEVVFEPVLVGRKIGPIELKLLNHPRTRVRFRGRLVRIRRLSSGADLATSLLAGTAGAK